MFFRKLFLPWTVSGCFETEDAFRAWLRRRWRVFTDLRMVVLAAAVLCLLAGYIAGRRPIMLLTIIPLVLVLLLSVALARMEAALDGQNKSEQ